MLLTPEQIIQLTGYKRPGKQRKALRDMGVRHYCRPDGKPVVDDSALCENKPQKPNEKDDWREWVKTEKELLFSATTPNEVNGTSGVYFLFYRGEIVYIGQSRNVGYRCLQHHWDRRKFDCVSVVPVFEDENRLAVETFYIHKLEPPQNSLIPPLEGLSLKLMEYCNAD